MKTHTSLATLLAVALAALLPMLMPSTARAHDEGPHHEIPQLVQAGKLDCSDMSSATQSDMNLCAGQSYQMADDALNEAWAQLRARRGEGHSMDLLRDAQRAWIAFRDAHCEAHAAPYEGGSIQPLIRFTCLQDVTARRTAQLRAFLNEP